jgi:butyrate kinase
MISKKILIIYPEVHETKVAVYRNNEPVFLKTIRHSEEELSGFEKVTDQSDFRLNLVMEELKSNQVTLEDIEMIMGRSGLVKPVSQGVYHINKEMVEDLEIGVMGVHATNLGGIIAYKIAEMLGKKAFMVNPVVVDELSDVARVRDIPILNASRFFTR